MSRLVKFCSSSSADALLLVDTCGRDHTCRAALSHQGQELSTRLCENFPVWLEAEQGARLRPVHRRACASYFFTSLHRHFREVWELGHASPCASIIKTGLQRVDASPAAGRASAAAKVVPKRDPKVNPEEEGRMSWTPYTKPSANGGSLCAGLDVRAFPFGQQRRGQELSAVAVIVCYIV